MSRARERSLRRGFSARREAAEGSEAEVSGWQRWRFPRLTGAAGREICNSQRAPGDPAVPHSERSEQRVREHDSLSCSGDVLGLNQTAEATPGLL